MTTTHLHALLEGLDVPNPDWWMMQPPEALRALGKAISDQAKWATHGDGIEQMAAQIRIAAARSNGCRRLVQIEDIP